MCGFGGYYRRKEYGPIWKVSEDKKHISFYAKTDSIDPGSYSGERGDFCIGSTEWCREHCYIRSKPLPEGFDDISAKYQIVQFRRDQIESMPFSDDFLKADFVTFFASGSINSLYYSGGERRPWNTLAETAITSLPLWHPSKRFRFFIRKPIEMEVNPDPNVIVIYSVDRDTPTEEVDWAIKSDIVRHISIVDHYDNRIIIPYVKSELGEMIECKTCGETNYLCFMSKKKSVILMDYQS